MKIAQYIMIGCLAHISFYVTNVCAFTYDEAVSGDITFMHFDFNHGINTISGSTAINNPADVTGIEDFGDFDDFSFTIDTGTQLSSITYAFSNVNKPSNSTSFGIIMGINDEGAYLGNTSVDISTTLSPSQVLSNILPFEEGLYTWGSSLFYGPPHGPAGPYDPFEGTSWDYTLSFDVASTTVVPIPAAVWLFGSALIGLIGIAARKTS